MAFHQDGPSRIGTPDPLSPLPTTGNLDHLVSLFHQTAADLGLPAAGFPPITPATFLPFVSGNKCSSLYSPPPFNGVSISRRPFRVIRLKSTTCPLRLLTWTSPRNPQISLYSSHLSVTLPPAFRQPLRPLSIPSALVLHNRPHTRLLGLVPPPPATPTPPAKMRERKELIRLHPHHCPIRSGPPPQLTPISRDTTCRLPLPHYMATLRRLPRNTPTPVRRRSSPRENTPLAHLGPPAI